MKIYVYGEEHLSRRRVRILHTTGTIVLTMIAAAILAMLIVR